MSRRRTKQQPAPAPAHVEGGPSVTLVIVDDNRLLREGLTRVLARASGFTVLAAVADGPAALDAVVTQRPTVMLLDVGLADGDSLAVCQRVHDLAPQTHVIVMGMVAAQEDAAAFIRAGAAGFIMKDATVDQFEETIRHVVAGDRSLPRALTESLFAQIVREQLGPVPPGPDDGIRLTRREQEIVALLGEGLSNKAIAARLYISLHTVKSHMHNILEKLSLHTRLEVAAFARGTEHDRPS